MFKKSQDVMINNVVFPEPNHKIHSSSSPFDTNDDLKKSFHEIQESSNPLKDHDVVKNVIICGITLKGSLIFQFLICIAGVFVFYLLYAILQEYLFLSYPGFNHGFFVTLCQFLFFTLFSGIQKFLQQNQYDQNLKDKLMDCITKNNDKKKRNGNLFIDLEENYNPKSQDAPDKISNRKNRLSLYIFTSALSVGSMAFGNEALAYISYPSKVLLKSSKLLLVMVVGLLFLKKKYKTVDYVASVLVGLGLFSLYFGSNVDEMTGNVKSMFNLSGLILMTLSLICDAFVGNMQELLLKKDSAINVIFYTHALGAFFLIFVCIGVDQFSSAMYLCVKYPSIILVIFVFSFVGFFGVQFIHGITQLFGILVTVSVGAFRKVLTVLLSFLVFPKPMSLAYFLSFVFVFMGVFLRVANKKGKKGKSAK